MTLLTPGFGTLSLQTSVRIHFCSLKPLRVRVFVTAAQETETGITCLGSFAWKDHEAVPVAPGSYAQREMRMLPLEASAVVDP